MDAQISHFGRSIVAAPARQKGRYQLEEVQTRSSNYKQLLLYSLLLRNYNPLC